MTGSASKTTDALNFDGKKRRHRRKRGGGGGGSCKQRVEDLKRN